MKKTIVMNRTTLLFSVEIRLPGGFIFVSEEYKTKELAEKAYKVLINTIINGDKN